MTFPPLSAAELAATHRPVTQASLLRARVFHAPEVFDFEQECWFARTWLCADRAAELAQPGFYQLVEAGPDSAIVVLLNVGVLDEISVDIAAVLLARLTRQSTRRSRRGNAGPHSSARSPALCV